MGIALWLERNVGWRLLMTHDAMRRLEGYPAAELRGATDALLDRVRRHVRQCDEIRRPAVEVAGL